MAARDGVDPRLVAALTRQLASRRGDRVGWKLGVGDAERIGGTLSVGHLTTSTLLEDGQTYDAGGAAIHADAEVAVVVGVGYAPALELVDLSNAGDGADAVVATNIFHRAVAFGDTRIHLPAELEGRLVVNGEVRTRAPVPRLDDRLAEAAAVLAAAGEGLQHGDRVITGSVAQTSVELGDDVTADFGELGRVTLRLA